MASSCTFEIPFHWFSYDDHVEEEEGVNDHIDYDYESHDKIDDHDSHDDDNNDYDDYDENYYDHDDKYDPDDNHDHIDYDDCDDYNDDYDTFWCLLASLQGCTHDLANSRKGK